MTSTVIRAAACLAVLTTLLLAAFEVSMVAGAFRKSAGAAPSLLLFGPGLLSLVLVRSGEHPMTVDMLFLVRLLTLVPGGAAFVGAVLLAGVNRTSPTLIAVWSVLLLSSALVAGTLCIGWEACAGPSDPDRDGVRAAHQF